MVVLCVSLCTFELKSFLIDKLGYFQSFWNWNDILLFVFSGLTLFQEIRALVKGNILELSNIDVLEEEDSDTAETLLRILKKKKKKEEQVKLQMILILLIIMILNHGSSGWEWATVFYVYT